MNIGEQAEGRGYVNVEKDMLAREENTVSLHGEETNVVCWGGGGGLIRVKTQVRRSELQGGMTATGFAHEGFGARDGRERVEVRGERENCADNGFVKIPSAENTPSVSDSLSSCLRT